VMKAEFSEHLSRRVDQTRARLLAGNVRVWHSNENLKRPFESVKRKSATDRHRSADLRKSVLSVAKSSLLRRAFLPALLRSLL
jgi:hypothetical protein